MLSRFAVLQSLIWGTLAFTRSFHEKFPADRGLWLGEIAAVYDNDYAERYRYFFPQNSPQQRSGFMTRTTISIESTGNTSVGPTHVSGFVISSIFEHKSQPALGGLCQLSVVDVASVLNATKDILSHKITSFELTQTQASFPIEIFQPVKKSGIYESYTAFCAKAMDRRRLQEGIIPQINVDSKVTIQQAHGFLSGHVVFSIWLHKSLGIAFAVMGVLWLQSMIRWYQSLLPHHWLIFAIIGTSAVSSGIQFGYFSHANKTAEPSSLFLFLATVCRIFQVEFARVVVLLASTGWGISRANLPEKELKFILGLGITHSWLTMYFEVYQMHMETHNVVLTMSSFIVKLCLAMIDSMVFLKIFDNLMFVLEDLEENKQFLKWSLYRKFSVMLLALCVLCSAMITAEIICVRNDIFLSPGAWPLAWLLTRGGWEFLFVGTLASAILLWKPHEHSQKYAYFKELSGVPDSTVGKSVHMSKFSIDDLDPTQGPGIQSDFPTMIDIMSDTDTDGLFGI